MDVDDVDIYSQRILEITAGLKSLPRLDNPDASARKSSRICGSSIEVDVRLDHGKVTQFSQAVDACALGQTSAAIVQNNIIGASEEEIRVGYAELKAFLQDNGPAPRGRWAELAVLDGVRHFTPRHKSMLLVFEALVDCLDQLNANRPVASA